ncbi:MAG: hypothetical protein ACSHWY_11770 [Octadecabacter sp.]
MAKRIITVSRSRGYFGVLRKLAVYLDGEKVADLKRGQSTPVPLEDGASGQIVLKMDWAKTSPFDLHSVPDAASVEIVTRIGWPWQWFGIGGLPFAFRVRYGNT